jgi:hypothetical protein
MTCSLLRARFKRSGAFLTRPPSVSVRPALKPLCDCQVLSPLKGACRDPIGLERVFDCARGHDQSSLQPSPPYRLLRTLRAVTSGRSDSWAFLAALRNHDYRFCALCAGSEPARRRSCSASDPPTLLHVLSLPPENKPPLVSYDRCQSRLLSMLFSTRTPRLFDGLIWPKTGCASTV